MKSVRRAAVARLCMRVAACAGVAGAAAMLSACGDNSAAATSGGAPPAASVAAIDYGILGEPDISPDVAQRSAQENLKRFRGDGKNPPQGDENHPITWMEIIEMAQGQRALFYAAAKADPSAITDQDRKWVKADEDAIIAAGCDNQGTPGAPELPAKACADAS